MQLNSLLFQKPEFQKEWKAQQFYNPSSFDCNEQKTFKSAKVKTNYNRKEHTKQCSRSQGIDWWELS